MAGHSIKINAETYAHVTLAAIEARQTVSQWMEAAARRALQQQDYGNRVARFRAAEKQAEDRLQPTPLPRDYGLDHHP